jgi:hypothetical protein
VCELDVHSLGDDALLVRGGRLLIPDLRRIARTTFEACGVYGISVFTGETLRRLAKLVRWTMATCG